MRARRKAAAGLFGVLGLVALYALAGFFLAPYFAKRELVSYAQTLGQQAEAGDIRFNPFTYTLEAKALALKQPDGRRIAAVDRLYVDFDFVSLVQRAWSFSDIVIEGGDIAVEVDRNGQLNLARLKPRAQPPGAQPAGESAAPAVTVKNLRAERVTVRYADESRRQPVSAVIGPLSAHVTDLSTIAGRTGRYTVASALPDGASLTGKGSVSLQPLASDGELRLVEFKLGTAWPFLRERLRIAEPRGTATLQAGYRYAQRNAQPPALDIRDADVQVKDLRLAMPDAQTPLLELASLHAKQARYDGATRAFTVSDMELARGRYLAALDASGRFNWAQLAAPQEEKTAAARWSARLDRIKLADIAVRYEDHTRRTPLVFDIAKGGASLKLALASEGDTARTTAEDIRLELQDLALRQAGAEAPLIRLASARLDGGRIDTRERVIAVAQAVLAGGQAELLRDSQGGLPLAQAFQSAKPPEPSTGPRWRYRVGAATLEDARLAVGDAGQPQALRYDLNVARLALKGMDPDSSSPIAFESSIAAAQGGTLAGAGTASQDFSRASAKIDVAGLSVLPLQPLLARHTTLALRSGSASATAAVDYVQGGKPLLRVAGAAKLSDVAIEDLRTKQRFMAVKAVAAEGAAFTLAPDRLDVKEVLVDQPETAIHISKDRKVNLAQVVKTEQAPAAQGEAPRAQERAADEPAAFPVRVGRLRLSNGTLDFSDASLVLPFSTRVTRLNGTVVGLANDAQSRAELKLGGRIEPSGYASAEGGVNLRHPTDFMDINVKFQNVEMSPLSPYTATFAGRKIDSGRVWLDLDYKISKKQLAGANKVLLENVVLGERVQAPGAMDLPLDLAIALLKDSEGRINMTVPVSGDIANPQFSYGGLIRDAIASAIGRIVTAPFRALASLFGGNAGGEELSKVRFGAGSARIYPPQREGLQKVAKAMQERPQLKVIVHGPYDPQRDADRLRRDPMRRSLAQAMGQQLKPGEDPGPVPYSDPETQRAIEQLYVARAGRDGLREFAAQYAKEQGKEPSAQDADQRRAYYERMFDRLVEDQPLPETAPAQLAGERAQAIAAVLAEAGIDRSRIEIGSLRTVADGAEPSIDAELQLAVRDGAS